MTLAQFHTEYLRWFTAGTFGKSFSDQRSEAPGEPFEIELRGDGCFVVLMLTGSAEFETVRGADAAAASWSLTAALSAVIHCSRSHSVSASTWYVRSGSWTARQRAMNA